MQKDEEWLALKHFERVAHKESLNHWMRFGRTSPEAKQKLDFIEQYKLALFSKFDPNQPRANDGKWTNGNNSQNKPSHLEEIGFRGKGRPKTESQMKKDIENDNKLKGVDRVDRPGSDAEKPHVHFGPGGKDGALNKDGSWKHVPKGNPVTRYISDWLEYYGWKTPPK